MIRRWLTCRLFALAYRKASTHPDFVIGGIDNPYLRRWWVIPQNRVFNIYLHEILRSDDDRALHDHPWFNCSLIIYGRYIEHTIAAGGIHRRRLRKSGDLVLRTAKGAHRLEIESPYGYCISLFFTGPRLRDWGFHCPDTGWKHWKNFSNPDGGPGGSGCA